jgi:hypothetical protein
LRSPSRKVLLKYVATSPPPAAHRTPHADGSSAAVAAGPLHPGRWVTARFAAPLSFSVDEPGWIVIEDSHAGFELARFDDPLTDITITAPAQVFDSSGRVQRLRSPPQALAAVASNPHARSSGRRRTSLGGVPATTMIVRVRPYGGYPEFCQSPCVPFFGLPAETLGAEAAKLARMWILSRAGRTVVVSAETDARRPDFTRVTALLRTLRFR